MAGSIWCPRGVSLCTQSPTPGPPPQNLKVCRWLSSVSSHSSLYATDFAKLRCLHWSHVLVYRVYREERFRGVELDEFGWEPSNHGIAQMLLTVGRFRFRIRLQQNNCALNFISHSCQVGVWLSVTLNASFAVLGGGRGCLRDCQLVNSKAWAPICPPISPSRPTCNTTEILICVWYRYHTQNAAASGFDHYISVKFLLRLQETNIWRVSDPG